MPNPPIEVVFWKKVIKFHDHAGKFVPGGIRSVEPLRAVVVGPSTLLCEWCHEPELGHARPGRQHPFTPMQEPGATLDVYYPDGQVERRYNVQYGEEANHWTEGEGGRG